MSDNLNLLLEAERRGILPADKAALLTEARNRGLIPSDTARAALPAGVAAAYDLSRRMRDQFAPGAPVPSPQDAAAYSTGMARAVGQGVTLGGSDEVIAGVKTAAGAGTYDDNLQNERDANKQFSEQYPISSTVGKIGGAIVATNPVFRAIPPMMSAPARVGTAAAVGAGIGGTEGFLSGEGDERVADAVKGAAVGSVVGGGLQTVAEGIRKGIEVGKNYFRAAPVEERAANALDVALKRDKTDLPTINAAVAGNRGADVVDVAGENVKRLARNVASQPGDAANVQRDFVRARGEKTYRDVNNAILSAFSPEDFVTKLQTSRDRLTAQANQAYTAATQATPFVRSAEIDDILNTPAGQQSLRNVMSRVMPGQQSALGPVNPQTGAVEKYRLDALRAVKSDLYARATGQNPLTGGNTEEAAYLKTLSGRLNDALKNASKPYRDAAAQYADEANLIEAMQKGSEEFLRMRPNEIREFLKGKTAGEREMFMNGAYDAMERGFLGGKNNRNFADTILNTPKIAENIKAALTKNEWLVLRGELQKNADRFVTTQFVNSRSGSQTAPRMMDEAAISGETAGDMARAGYSAIQGNFGSALNAMASPIVRAVRNQGNRARGIDEQSASLLADYLLRPSTSAEYAAASQRLLQAMPRATAQQPRRIVSPAGLLGFNGP
jgi:hypothetical protein